MSQESRKQAYLEIVSHYENCLERHGDTHRGVDWPNSADAQTRYDVMLEVIRPASPRPPVTLLDVGCGASHLFDHMCEKQVEGVLYSGLDISPKFVELSRCKHPSLTYYCLDILQGSADLPVFDYVVMNGVLTEKRSLSWDEMWEFSRQMIRRVFEHCRLGIAFNVMMKQVDWERDDLFHLPFDTLAAFLVHEVSRDLVIRCDYRLYEYTTYVYRR